MHEAGSRDFSTEEEAQKFADSFRSRNSSPVSEVYVRGPFFMEASKVYKGLPAAETYPDVWKVSYEVFR